MLRIEGLPRLLNDDTEDNIKYRNKIAFLDLCWRVDSVLFKQIKNIETTEYHSPAPVSDYWKGKSQVQIWDTLDE